MKKKWGWGIMGLPLIVLLMGLESCPGSEDDDDTPDLTWYYTCGDPVCSGYTPSGDDIPMCTDEEAGDPCSTEGATCDPKDDCNRLLVCAAEDPTQQDGGCPISKRDAKYDIHYLGSTDLERLHDEVLGTRLATWRYKGRSKDELLRLGFIIDDQPNSAAVLPSGERVDVYGYTSMAVAAIQVQERALNDLRQEVSALKQELATLQSGKCRKEGNAP